MLSNTQKPTDTTPKTNTFGQPLDKLIDGELPFGWMAYQGDFFKTRDDYMVSLAVQSRKESDPERKIHLLNALIEYYYAYKAECQRMGECHEKWFEQSWIECDYISKFEDELSKLTKGNR